MMYTKYSVLNSMKMFYLEIISWQEQTKNTSYSLRCSLSTDYKRWNQRVCYNRMWDVVVVRSECTHESCVACVSSLPFCVQCSCSWFVCVRANAYNLNVSLSLCIKYVRCLRSVDCMDNVRATYVYVSL